MPINRRGGLSILFSQHKTPYLCHPTESSPDWNLLQPTSPTGHRSRHHPWPEAAADYQAQEEEEEEEEDFREEDVLFCSSDADAVAELDAPEIDVRRFRDAAAAAGLWASLCGIAATPASESEVRLVHSGGGGGGSSGGSGNVKGNCSWASAVNSARHAMEIMPPPPPPCSPRGGDVEYPTYWAEDEEYRAVYTWQQPRLQHARSVPVSVPPPSYNCYMEMMIGEAGEGEEEEEVRKEERLPPHELAARGSSSDGGSRACSSVFEGVGRTLKGRDLSRVRHAVLKQTGFI